MDQLWNKIGSTAESLLEQVDKKGAEISQDVRSGNRAARNAAQQIEKKLEVLQRATSPATTANSNSDDSVSKQLLQLQRDLAACGEVLANSQQLAAERESKLNLQIERLKEERELRDNEFMQRIKQLEYEAQERVETIQEVEQLRRELEVLQDAKNADELQLQAEKAKKEAEHFAKALQASEKEFSLRTFQLEQANLALGLQLSEQQALVDILKQQQQDSVVAAPTTTQGEEEEENEEATKQMRRRLVQLEDLNANLDYELSQERQQRKALELERESCIAYKQRCETLQNDLSAMQKELAEARAFVVDTDKTMQLEKRLEALSKHVEIKQRQIDVLRSEKAGLIAQQQQVVMPNVSRQRAHSPTPVPTSSGFTNSKTPRLRIRHRGLNRAVDVMDGLTISLGHVMRASPVLRLAFLCYICLLHLWVLHVINFTSADVDAAAKTGAYLRTAD